MSVGKMMRNMLLGGEAGAMMDLRQAARDNAALEGEIDVLVDTANQRLNKMAADIKDLKASRMEMSAAGNSALRTIELMARKIAQLTGESPESVLSLFNQQRSRFYDETLNEMIAEKSLVDDPRETDVIKQRKWYTSDASTL